jgi:GNAT superfamily N-acetyltransferase
MGVTITGVATKADRLKFVKFPINLYKNNPYYVPAFVLDELATLDPKKNPAFEFCEAKLFLAYSGKQVVGRIAAIINHRSNEIWNQKQARFGFVDFIDDNEVVDALFGAAEDWVQSMGMEAVHGPLGFTDLDREGLLIEGFDKLGTMVTLYCHPYYQTQIERIGYRKDTDWNEFLIQVPDNIPERHQRIAKIVADKYGLKVLKFNSKKEIEPYIDQIFELLNKAYKPLYGYVELSKKQIDYYVKTFISLLRWEIVPVIVKEDTNQVIAFGIAAPSLSKALQASRGKLFPFGWIGLLKALKSKNNPIIDLMIIGIDPEYQGKGINAMVFADMISSAYKCGFRYAESNPELETNNKMSSLWDGFVAENHKKRRAYIKKLKN